MNSPDPRLSLILALASILWFGHFAIDKTLTTDETEQSAAPAAIARTGRPLYYVGRTHSPKQTKWTDVATGRHSYQYGLQHTCLYNYCLAAFLKVFGFHYWALRLPGLLCLIANLFLLKRLAARLSDDPGNRTFAYTALLYATSPLILQLGLVVDIDNTLLACVTLSYLLVFLQLEEVQPRSTRWIVTLSLLLTLAFWIKEFAPPFLIGPTVLYLALKRRWRAIGYFAVCCVAMTVLFISSWLFFCWWQQLPADYFLRFSVLDKLAKGDGVATTMLLQSSSSFLLRVVGNGLLTTLVWISPYVPLLFLGVLISRFLPRSSYPKRLDLVLVYTVTAFLVTKGLRPGGGWILKYEFPAHGPLLLLCGAFLANTLPDLTRGDLVFVALIALLLARLELALIWDRLAWLYSGNLAALVDCGVPQFFLATFLATGFLLRLLRRSWSVVKLTSCALLICVVGANLSEDFVQTGDFTTNLNWTNYRETGLDETVAYVKSILPKGKSLLCRMDIGFYLSDQWKGTLTDWVDTLYVDTIRDPVVLKILLDDPHYAVVVLDSYCQSAVVGHIREAFTTDRVIGWFEVLKRKPASSPPRRETI